MSEQQDPLAGLSRIKNQYFEAEAYGSSRREALGRLLKSARDYFDGQAVQADHVFAEELDTIESARVRYLDGQIDVAYRLTGTFELLQEDPGPPTARPIEPRPSWE